MKKPKRSIAGPWRFSKSHWVLIMYTLHSRFKGLRHCTSIGDGIATPSLSVKELSGSVKRPLCLVIQIYKQL